ncbi:phage antirepressor [Streptomyces sp. NPDC001339]|uniref:phage antirepressor n=1 Tax=Streptomyces sp. NPDC001339 TaxID=3364563 RepID=UPI0036CAE553
MMHGPSETTPAVFTFPDTGQTVRTIMIDGAPWWVARDVLDILGLTNPTEALRGLDDDEFSTAEVIDSTGRRQPNAYIVTEPGLYSLILRSRKPQARTFKRWITHEVLPQIRRTGTYTAPGAVPTLPDLSQPSGVLALAEEFVRTARALVVADERVKEMEPKAEAHDAYMAAHDSDRLVREVAKLLEVRERWLWGFLVDEGLIFPRHQPCGNRFYDAYAQYRPHFRPTEHVVSHTITGPCSHYTLRVTPRGVGLIRRRLLAAGYLTVNTVGREGAV